jgi:hypothetical protein
MSSTTDEDGVPQRTITELLALQRRLLFRPTAGCPPLATRICRGLQAWPQQDRCQHSHRPAHTPLIQVR